LELESVAILFHLPTFNAAKKTPVSSNFHFRRAIEMMKEVAYRKKYAVQVDLDYASTTTAAIAFLPIVTSQRKERPLLMQTDFLEMAIRN